MNQFYRSVLLILFVPGLWFGSTVAVAEVTPPSVHGMGVKLCESYVAAYRSSDKGEAGGIDAYLAYRDWLAGLVTGLSLATGMDILQGVEVKGAMRRILVYCEDNPTDDFFNASTDLIKTLSGLNN